MVTWDSVGIISDRHDSVSSTITRKSNFLRKFKAPYLQKLIINICIFEYIEFASTRCVISIYTNDVRLTLTGWTGST
ncbi:hypothetical protein Ahy_B02g058693 isoform B [Arachis hypogaea]|uniref:Uncharacterized protein n=1 Tax=Arachis hypogaea TaxID=3818 RepID=A0A445AF72_ARAHY|nr:hypothetical protein Ahy_B02g058693 isoform B [Arachis hypogaea]